MDRIALPAFGALAVVAVLLMPTVRFVLRARRLPMALQGGGVARAVMSLGLAGSCLGYGVIFVTYAVAGPEVLGVWFVPAGARIAGWMLAVLGIAIVATAQTQMGMSWRMGIVPERTELVMNGLFGHVRNPIFSGMLATLLGMVLVAPCAWTVAGFVLVLVLLAWEARREEAHLCMLHGAPYRQYAARVGRFFPFVGRLRG